MKANINSKTQWAHGPRLRRNLRHFKRVINLYTWYKLRRKFFAKVIHDLVCKHLRRNIEASQNLKLEITYALVRFDKIFSVSTNCWLPSFFDSFFYFNIYSSLNNKLSFDSQIP